MAKLHFEFLLRPTYSPDLASSDYYIISDPKRILQEKRFGSNGAVIAETEAYLEAKDKSFYKKGIEILEKRWNECITLEGDYVDEWSRILPKSCCFIIHSMNLLSDVLHKEVEEKMWKELYYLFYSPQLTFFLHDYPMFIHFRLFLSFF